MVLVDTSVWVDFLRGRDAPHVAALCGLLARGDGAGVAPPILQEILQGAENTDRFEAWQKRFTRLPCCSPADFAISAVQAARLFLRCRLRGVTPRSSNDCLIACIAIEHDVPLLHNDHDFVAIASVEPRLRLYGAAAP